MSVDLALAERAASLHADALVCDLTMPWVDYGRAELRNQTLPRMAQSGANFVSLTLASDAEGLLDVVKLIARERRLFRAMPAEYRLVATVDDILVAKQQGQLAVSFNLQGTNALGGNADLVSLLYDLGVRQMLLVYNKKNFVGDGCHERTDGGLSEFGIRLVAEMNRVGMIVDVSHTGYRTSMEAMEISQKPIVFSHSNPKSLWEHDRNIRDDQAKACAATGGLVGVVGVGIFMGDNDASTELFARQIDYYVDLIGPDYVGLGLDYVYDVEAEQAYMASIESPPRGNYDKMTAFFRPEQLPELTELLLKKGYAETAIRGILGENFLRVARSVWR